MKKVLWLLPIALGLGLSGCDEVGFVSGSITTQRTSYYGGEPDFYYVERTPYSRSYGPLVYRDSRYYYRRSGALVIYDRPTRRWRDSDRERREYRHDDRYDHRDDRREDWRDRQDDHDEDRDDRRGVWRGRRY